MVGTVVSWVTVVVGTVVTTVVPGVVGMTLDPGESRLDTVAIAFVLTSKVASTSLYPASLKITSWLPTGTVMMIGVTAFEGTPSSTIWAPCGVVERYTCPVGPVYGAVVGTVVGIVVGTTWLVPAVVGTPSWLVYGSRCCWYYRRLSVTVVVTVVVVSCVLQLLVVW